MKDDSLFRNMWKLVCVDQIYLDDDGLVRKVCIVVVDYFLDNKGRRIRVVVFFERFIQKLILFFFVDLDEDWGIFIEELYK